MYQGSLEYSFLQPSNSNVWELRNHLNEKEAMCSKCSSTQKRTETAPINSKGMGE